MMAMEGKPPIDPRLWAAVAELQDLIRSHYPMATFTVGEADDSDGVYVRAIVNVDDTDEVIKEYLDHLVDLQVTDDLPIYVVPVRTPERIAVHGQREQEARAADVLPL